MQVCSEVKWGEKWEEEAFRAVVGSAQCSGGGGVLTWAYGAAQVKYQCAMWLGGLGLHCCGLQVCGLWGVEFPRHLKIG